MQHQVDHGDIEDVLAAARQHLIIFAEAAIAIEPAERALDDSAQGEDGEALGLAAAHDFNRPARKFRPPVLE